MNRGVQPATQPPDFRRWGERGALVQRILESEPFRRSAKMREFLAYVAEHTLDSDVDSVTEQQIGVAVFNRPADYNPGDDSIVRVQARQLRSKLAEYFAGEGRNEPVLVRIPKGGYVPAFQSRLKTEPHPKRESTAAPSAVAAAPFARPVHVILLCLAAFVVGAVAQQLWSRGGSREGRRLSEAGLASDSRVEPAAKVANPLLGRVLAPGQPTKLFMEDRTLGLSYAFRDLDEDISLEAYREGAARSEVAERLERETPWPRLALHMRSSRFVGFENARFAFNLARQYPQLSENVTIHYPEHIHIRDLKDANCIILGGARVNPWVKLYEEQLNFQHRYYDEENGGFDNLEPKDGEQAVYGDWRGAYYTRIALLPNLGTDYTTLLISGMGPTATEAGLEFVLNPDSADLLPSPLHTAVVSGVKHVEILVEVTRVLRAPHSVSVAAWRAHPVHP